MTLNLYNPEHGDQPLRRIRISEIIEVVSRVTNLTEAQITGPCRMRDFVDARTIVANLGHTQAGRSSAMIGRSLGNRDHTTVLNYLHRHPRRMGGSQDYETIYNDVSNLVHRKRLEWA